MLFESFSKKNFLIVFAALPLTIIFWHQPKSMANTTRETIHITAALANLPLSYLAYSHKDSKAKMVAFYRFLRDCSRLTHQGLTIYNDKDKTSVPFYIPIVLYDLISLLLNTKQLLKTRSAIEILDIKIQDIKQEAAVEETEINDQDNITFKILKAVPLIFLPLVETWLSCAIAKPDNDATLSNHYFCYIALRIFLEFYENFCNNDKDRMKALDLCCSLFGAISELEEINKRNNNQKKQSDESHFNPQQQQQADDPHERLGVRRDADESSINKAFRELSRKHHPDKGGDAEEYKKIVAARDALLRH